MRLRHQAPVEAERVVTVAAALIVSLVATSVLVGWLTGTGELTSWGVPGATQKFNVALCLIALAVSLRVRGRVALGLAGLVALVAALSLVEYGLGSLGIDELLMEDRASDPNPAGRMAPATAVSLLCLTLSRASLQFHRRRLAELSLLVPLTIGGLAVLGHVFGAEQLYAVVTYSTTSLPTATCLVVLAVGIAFLVPGGVALRIAADHGAGATLLRHITPVVVVGLPLLGLVPLAGRRLDLFGERFGVAVMVALSVVVLLAVAAVAARRLDRFDRQRLAAQHKLAELNEQLRLGRDREWERAEELGRSLRQERAAFERAVAKIDDLIWTIEILPDGTLRREFHTPNASGIYGGPLAPEDMVATVAERTHPDDRHVIDEMARKLTGGEHAEAEFRIVGFDGETRWAWARATPRREGGRLFIDGITTNITERRQLAERRERLLELEQQQVAKLRELQQLREELLAVTGHELRTPLSVILGYAELLLQDSGLTAVQRKQLEAVTARSRQMAHLVDDIFDLTKFSAGIATLDLKLIALDDAVRRCVEEHQEAARQAGLTIDADLRQMTVAADPMRLRQVLDNLLSNAVKYSLSGGHISVTTRCEAERAIITVGDAGIGIPEEELEHVFDRMYRASSAKEREIQGTGLGLAVARALVEAHDGTIAAARRAEGGTEFTVSLPLQPASTATLTGV